MRSTSPSPRVMARNNRNKGGAQPPKQVAKKNKNNKNGKKGKRTGGRAPTGNMVSTNSYAGQRLPTTRMLGGSTVVSHTETYGVNVLGTAGFSVASAWALQPGISNYSRGSPLGIWLPQIAGNFDNFEILNLKFTYRAACSTLEPGLAMFAFEPNPEGNVPSTYQEFRNMYSVDGSVHANLTFDVSQKCRRPLLTRKGTVVNLPSYDAGKVYFGTIGCTENAKLGFIDVSYTVRLFNPQSSASTVSPVVTYVPILPEVRYAWSPSSDATANVSTDCLQPLALFMNSYTAAGATDMFTVATGVPAFSNTIQGGCVFANTVQSTWKYLKAAYAGRYSVSCGFAGDFKDLNLFAMLPIYIGGTVVPCRTQVYSSMSGTSVTEVECVARGWRGFTGTVTGDPNPGTDLGFYGDWEIALEAGDGFGVALGYRNYNSVSTSATLIFRGGCGPSFISIRYLGPKY